MKTLCLPNRITIHDTLVREGFQREERLIPTDAKLWVVRQLVKAGFKRLDVTNFANPSRLPQFADAEELLKQIRTHRDLIPFLTDVEFSAVTINQMALDRALAAHRQGAGVSGPNAFIPAELQNKKELPLKTAFMPRDLFLPPQ